jgi:hypothetical protein
VIITEYGAQIGVYGIAVYAALCMHSKPSTQRCWPSHRTIAKEIGCSAAKVKGALAQLKDLKLIAIDPHYDAANQRQTSNTYTLLDPPATTDTPPQYHEIPTKNNPNLVEQSQGEAGATAPQQPPNDPPKKKQKATPPKAIQIYRKEFHTYPRKETWEDIVSIVGEEPEHLKTWARVCHQWLMKGYYKFNITGLIECFHKGGVKTGGSRANGGSSTPRTQAAEPSIAGSTIVMGESNAPA